MGFDLEHANDNTLVGNKADGKGSSDESSGFAVIFDSKSNVLEGNKATHFARWGFAVGLEGTSGNTLTGNIATQNDWGGFVLIETTANTLTKNRSLTNGVGFVMLEGATGNTLTRNVAQANSGFEGEAFDAWDVNGPGANTWLNNTFG